MPSPSFPSEALTTTVDYVKSQEETGEGVVNDFETCMQSTGVCCEKETVG